MNETSGETRLPIRDILNANPTWMRSDFGDLNPLMDSMKERGIVVPLLLDTSFLALDGGRRTVAAKKLGWTEVPVTVTDDWYKAIVAFKRARRAESMGLPFEPMRLLHLFELDDQLIRLYQPIRRRNSLATRHARQAGIMAPATGSEPRGHIHNAVTIAFAEAFGFEIKDATVRRHIFSTLRTSVRLGPAVQELAYRAVNEVDDKGGRLHSLYALLQDITQQREIKPRRMFRRDAPSSAIQIQGGRVVKPDEPPNPSVARVQADRMRNIVEMLAAIGEEIRHLPAINPAMPAETAEEILRGYIKANRKVSPLKGLLRGHIREVQRREQS